MKQQQVKEIAYLGKRVYFGNKPYTLVLKYKTCLNNEATIIGIDSNILKNFGDKQVYISYERGEEK